jgi:superfamily II DNA or RNA helicase
MNSEEGTENESRFVTDGLAELELEPSYRSSNADLARDFYGPCLSRAIVYRRAAGYFSSSSMRILASGLTDFVDSDGKMDLVVSPELSPEDAAAIAQGYEDREEIVASRLLEVLGASEMPDPERDTFELLAWLVSEGRLDIKVALVHGRGRVGIYHEKFGVFLDHLGNSVAFTGSANESQGGLSANFESIDVYASWLSADEARVNRKSTDFDELWSGKTPNLEIMEFPSAARAKLLELAPRDAAKPTLDREDEPAGEAPVNDESDPYRDPTRPRDLTLRDYQEVAITSWLGNEGRGVLEMATGSGKTITALSAVADMASLAREQSQAMLVVIACPFANLVEQWSSEAERFGVNPLKAYASSTKWTKHAVSLIGGLKAAGMGTLVVTTTNSTFQTSTFQEILSSWSGPMLLIVDEVHNAGAEGMARSLPEYATYRLGLSATPDRWLDEGGNQRVSDYFGPVTFSYALKDAIDDGALSSYKYFPTKVEFKDDEQAEYLEISHKIGVLMAQGGSSKDEVGGIANTQLEHLLFRRARLVGGARGKIAALAGMMEPFKDEAFSLVYCSDATSLRPDGEDPRQDDKQLVQVVDLLGNELGMDVATYTSREGLDERRERLEAFAAGELQCLVAMRCLDEGVDIPAVRRAFILASTTNPRQFIQRRGRVLRRSSNKEHAEIFDFIVTPPKSNGGQGEISESERRLVKKELARAVEFAETSMNGASALLALDEIAEIYNLQNLD